MALSFKGDVMKQRPTIPAQPIRRRDPGIPTAVSALGERHLEALKRPSIRIIGPIKTFLDFSKLPKNFKGE
jgi:hypothetical protein